MTKAQKRSLALAAAAALALAAVYWLLDAALARAAAADTIVVYTMQQAPTYLQYGTDAAIELEVRDGTWTCPQYADLALNQTRVGNMCDKAATLTVLARVARGADRYAEFGLDTPANTILVQTGAESHTLYLGDINSATGDYYLRVDGSEQIYAVDATFYNLFSGDIFDLAARETVAGYSIESCDGFCVESEKTLLTFSKTADTGAQRSWVLENGGGTSLPANSAAVEQTLSDILKLTYDRLTAYHPTAQELTDCGLEQPTLRIALHGAPGDFVLLVGAATPEEDGYYACAEGGSGIHVITALQLETLLYLTPEQFYTLDVAPVLPEMLTGLTVQYAGQEYRFARSGDAWQMNGALMEDKTFNGFYYPLYALQADKTVSDMAAQLTEAPVLALTYQRQPQDGGDVQVAFITLDQNYYAVLRDGQATLLINRQKVNSLIAQLQRLVQ